MGRPAWHTYNTKYTSVSAGNICWSYLSIPNLLPAIPFHTVGQPPSPRLQRVIGELLSVHQYIIVVNKISFFNVRFRQRGTHGLLSFVICSAWRWWTHKDAFRIRYPPPAVPDYVCTLNRPFKYLNQMYTLKFLLFAQCFFLLTFYTNILCC